MPRLSPVSPRKLVRAFEKLGFRLSGQVGSHLKLSKPGCRPIIIPTNKKEVEVGIMLANCKTAGISRVRRSSGFATDSWRGSRAAVWGLRR